MSPSAAVSSRWRKCKVDYRRWTFARLLQPPPPTQIQNRCRLCDRIFYFTTRTRIHFKHTHTHIHAASVNSRRIIYYLMLIILSFPRAVRVSLVFYFNSIFYFVSTPFVCVYLFNCLTLYYHYRRQLYNNKKNYTIYIIFYSFILALKVKSIYVHVCVLEKR